MTRDEYFDQLELPLAVRNEQIAWERRHTLLRLWRIKGIGFKDLLPVMAKLGSSAKTVERIRNLCRRAIRDENHPGWKHGSPIERWLKQQTTPRALYNELQEVLNPKPVKKVRKRPPGPRPPRRLPYSWQLTWLRLPKFVDIPLDVRLPEGWEGQGQVIYVPQAGTTVFRLLCTTPRGEYYCDLGIDDGWNGYAHPLFVKALDKIFELHFEAFMKDNDARH